MRIEVFLKMIEKKIAQEFFNKVTGKMTQSQMKISNACDTLALFNELGHCI